MLNNDRCSPDNRLSEYCDRFQLTDIVTVLTRITDTSSTLLDVILTTHPQRFCCTTTLQLGISDHDMVVTIRKWKLPKPPPKLISYRSMKRFDTDIFLQDLNSVPWDCAFIHDDINDIWSGADGISPRLLKLAGPRIFSSLTKLINQCIVSGTWPTDWKTSIVSPMYKKGTETLKSNYRPVSVLSAVSKVAERVIFDQLYEFSLDFLSGNLSGFLKGHSCTTALLKTFEDIRKKLDSSEHSAAITIDLSKAFDSINHDLLLAKLSAYGVTKDALQLLRSYLTDRKQHVKTDGILSDWQIVRCGVPQGSILGPLLFNIYMNDVNFSDISCSLRFYADDTTGYSSNLCPSTLQINLQNNVGLLASWFCENFLAINHSKSQSIVFNRATLPTPFVIDSNELDYVTHIKLLGVVIDNSLSFNVHIKEVCRKVNTKVSILRRIRKFIPSDVMIKLYKAFILPHFEYASPLFIGLSKGLSAKLESTNAFALRTLLNYSKSTAYEELLKTANIKSLEHRRIEQALILVYKSIHNQTPNYIQEMFSLRSNGYSLRGHFKVVLPRPTSSYM